jgi:glycosyltransferase involved in cell wall biosynthesis
MDFYTRKLAYIWLRLSEYSVNLIVFVYSIVYQKRQKNEIKKIAAFYYSPDDQVGTDLRLGGWKSFFEKDGFQYDIFFINKFQDGVERIDKGTWTSKYLYFALSIWRRLPQLLKLHNYDALWVDRCLIPYYPRKSSFIEKRISKVVSKMIVDSTDGGDYQDNPILMEGVFRAADELTVGYKHLKENYSKRFKVTQVFWTIPINNYIRKENYIIDKIPIIGWMGSPANFQFVLDLLPALQKLSKDNKFILKYICRQNFDDKLIGIETEHVPFGDDYYEQLASFDIGISPFLVANLRTKGKIAMKHQEFLLMGTPQVCSPVAISEFVSDRNEVMIADSENEWVEKLSSLIENQDLREKLGKQSKLLFDENYTYESQYQKLKTALTTL